MLKCEVLDLFCGAGGASDGIERLGFDVAGVELHKYIANSHELGGHETFHADVAALNPQRFSATGMWMSPPCTSFSTAGPGSGRSKIDELVESIDSQKWDSDTGDISDLVLQVGRWVDQLHPQWFVCEQVTPAFPIWEAYKRVFHEWGYFVEVLNIDSSHLGFWQSRSRSYLLASSHKIELPELNSEKAIGWGEVIDRPDQLLRPGHKTNTSKHRFRPSEEPAPTMAFGHNFNAWGWVSEDGSFEKMSLREALVLQGFDGDRKLCGSHKLKARQIGNAVIPFVAETLVSCVM